MKRTLYFVTTNASKFQEVSRWLAQLAPWIELEQASFDIPEHQSLDIREVALEKARHAWIKLKKPLIIDDGGVVLEKFGKFPGALSRYVYEGIGLEGLWLLAKDDPRAYFFSCLVYADQDQLEPFEGLTKGTIVAPRPVTDPAMPFTFFFVPAGTSKTVAEVWNTQEEEAIHHRFQALQKLVEYLKNH